VGVARRDALFVCPPYVPPAGTVPQIFYVIYFHGVGRAAKSSPREGGRKSRDSRSGGASRNTAGRSRGIVNARANTGAVLPPRVSLTSRHGKALNCPGTNGYITGVMSNPRNVKHGRAAQD
jgi:hypothetical protein